VATRYFSLDEAQALVPRVRSLLGEALQLHGHLRVAIARLSEAGHEITWAMLRGEDRLGGDDSDKPDPKAQQGLERSRMIYLALRERITAIEELGVEVKGVVEGLVDFHSWCEGEHVLLCWKLGEPEIRFFHGVEDGFAGRRSIKGHHFTANPELRSQQSG
jgi:hypothetical protein